MRWRRWAALLATAAIVVALDQLAKNYIVANVAYGTFVVPIPALSDFFALTLSHNRGAAFSLLPQLGDIFLIFALLVVVGIPLYYRQLPAGHWPERIALGLVLGGALGNAIDRLQYGYVIDWVLLRIPNLITNVSNFADHAIVLGIGIIFLRSIFARPPAQPSADQPANGV
jgi:signal peptidase II